MQHYRSTHQNTTSNLLLKNQFKRHIKVQQRTTSRGSSVHTNLSSNFRGGDPENVSFLQISWILMVSDKTVHKAFRIHKSLFNVTHWRIFVYFHYLPKTMHRLKVFNYVQNIMVTARTTCTYMYEPQGVLTRSNVSCRSKQLDHSWMIMSDLSINFTLPGQCTDIHTNYCKLCVYHEHRG